MYSLKFFKGVIQIDFTKLCNNTLYEMFGNSNKEDKEMDKKDEMMIVNNESLVKKIYIIRGQKVMLDFELAEIYGYETKNFNRQVKNNIEKFEGEDFMFRLTEEEMDDFRCKIFTSSWGGTRYLPYVFTEQGIYMLMTVLKGDLAVRQSRALVRTFKQMKDYICRKSRLDWEKRVFAAFDANHK